MHLKTTVKQFVPQSLWQIGLRGYNSVYRYRLSTIVGCQTTDKVLAITFDDGPDLHSTPQILDLLDNHGAKATFFALGRNVAAHPKIARDIVQRGHELGNHTYSHPRLSDIQLSEVARELSQCKSAIVQAAGVKPVLMRPPQAAQTPRSFMTARLQGYQTVHWSNSGDDWLGDSAEIIAQQVLKNLQPGGIILLHDGCEPLYPGQPDYERTRDRQPTIEALSILFDQLRGYRFVTVSEMMHAYPAIKKVWFI